MKKHLYIHIGTHKTATTALQSFLDLNKVVFGEAGIKIIEKQDCLNIRSFFIPYRGGFGNYANIKGNKNKWLKDFIVKLKKNHQEQIVISNEGLCIFEKNLIGSFLELFKDYKVSLICYLRRQDYWLESFYQEVLRTHVDRSQRFQDWIEDLPDLPRRTCDSYNALNDWANYIGKENIIVKVFEKQQLVNHNVYDDFSSIFGIKLTQGFRFPNSKRTNISLSQDILELIRIAKKIPVVGVEDQRKNLRTISRLITSITPQTCIKTKGTKNIFLSPIERMEILKKYEHNNQLVAREYLGREDGKLFYDPLPDINEPYEPHQLTLEKIAPIFVEMIYTLNKRIEKLEKQQVLHAQQLLELQRSRREKIKHLAKRIIPKPLHPLAQKTWNTLKTSTSSKTDI